MTRAHVAVMCPVDSRIPGLRRVADAFGAGASAVWQEPPGGTPILQAIEFDADKFTAAAARDWLKRHDFAADQFVPAVGITCEMMDVSKCPRGLDCPLQAGAEVVDGDAEAETTPVELRAGATGLLELMAQAPGDADALPRVSMLAYTGIPMKLEGFQLPVVVDLETLKVPKSQKVPILRGHDTDRIAGHSDTIDVSPQRLKAGGVLSGTPKHTVDVLHTARRGFPWQVSIGAANTKRLEHVPAGESVKVNGRKWDGPILVARHALLRELSILPMGADGNTDAAFSAAVDTGLSASFCPTGPGGGVDPSCPPGGGSGGGTHGVKLPKDRSKLKSPAAAQALDQMGYKLGKATFNLKNKTTTYELTKPDGTKSTASSDEVKEIVYRGVKAGTAVDILAQAVADLVAYDTDDALEVGTLMADLAGTFCPTGPGGGVDNSCGKDEGGGAGGEKGGAQGQKAVVRRARVGGQEIGIDADGRIVEGPEHLIGKRVKSKGEGDKKDEAGKGEASKDQPAKGETTAKGRELKNPKEIASWADQHYSDWNESLDPKEFKAIEKYADHHFEAINGALRKDNPGGRQASTIKALDSAMDRTALPEDVTVFRGVRPGKLAEDLKVGDTVEDKAYLSTSFHRAVAEKFAHGAMLEVRVPKGSKGIPMDAVFDGGSRGEHELMLPRGSSLKVLSVRQTGGKRHIVAEVVRKSVGVAAALAAALPTGSRGPRPLLPQLPEAVRDRRLAWDVGDVIITRGPDEAIVPDPGSDVSVRSATNDAAQAAQSGG